MTMNCKQCQNMLDEMLDGELGEAVEARCLEHIEQCEDCRAEYVWAQRVREGLATMPAPAMRTAFPAEALEKVKHHYQPKPRVGFIAGFSSAIAASLALWFAVAMFSPQGSTNQAMPSISLSVGQVQQVNLVFNSPEHMTRASFTLLLPASTELEGYPGRRELTWTASLHKGKNRLSLPLRVNAARPGELVARIKHGNDVKVFRLKLDVKSRSSSSAQFKQA